MADDLTGDGNLWGEIQPSTSASVPWSEDVFNNVKQDVIIHSVQNILFKKHFYNKDEKSYTLPDKEEEIKVDDPMKRTVKLLKYKNDLKNIVDHSKLQPDLFDLEEQIKNISNPLKDEPKKDSTKIIFFKHIDSDFIKGKCSEVPPNITEESALITLRSSVTTVLAFVGFTETTIMPLQILTEVVENYIVTFLKLLSLNVERERIKGESGFCDVVDRTFHEMGIGSVRNLVSYYQENVLKIKEKKVKACKDELVSYEDSLEKLKEEMKQHILESNITDMEDENLVIPELHVTSMVGNEMLSESFETGLQMLQTLERQQLKHDSNSELETGDMKTLKRKRKQ